MMQNLCTWVVGGTLAVLFGALAAPVFKLAFGRMRRQGLAFALVAAGFLVSMATKPTEPKTTVIRAEPVAGASGVKVTVGSQEIPAVVSENRHYYTVTTGAAVRVQWTADEGYSFPDRKSALSKDETASRDANVTNEVSLAEGERPGKFVKEVAIDQGSALALAVGTATNLTFAIDPGDAATNSVAWTTSDKSVVSVVTAGAQSCAVAAQKAGTATVTLTVRDRLGYERTATCAITVTAVATVFVNVPPVEGADLVGVYTNAPAYDREIAPPYRVFSNEFVQVVWAAKEGYEFAGGNRYAKSAKAENATTTVTIPQTDLPTLKRFDIAIDGKVSTNVAWGTVYTAVSPMVNVTNGWTNIVCTGWSGNTNGTAAAGTASRFSFLVTGASAIDWAYCTNFLFEAQAFALAVSSDPSELGSVDVRTNGIRVVGAVLSGTVVDVTATILKSNCTFVGWTGRDDAGNAIVFTDPASLASRFTMPGTNAAVRATFAVDPAYKATAWTVLTNASSTARAKILNLSLTEAEKAQYENRLNEAVAEAVYQLQEAATPAAVDAVVATATVQFAEIAKEAQAWADREWTIETFVDPADAGTVEVAEKAQRWTTVTVTAMPASDRYAFVNWVGQDAAGNAIAFADATNAVTTFTMPETNVSVKAVFVCLAEYVSFSVSATNVTEGEDFAIAVNGGSKTKPTQVTVSLQKNTLTSFTSYYGVDTKGKDKRCSFPLVLNWDAGDTEPKYIGFSTKEDLKKIMVDQFLTLQLGSDVNFDGVGTDVCTVTVRDSVEPTEADPYVRALAWPANGGKVSGYGTIKLDSYGNYKSTKTLTATANKWADFAGWYRAMTNDANKIDLDSGCITEEKKLKVGKGTDYGAGTYFAYFTNVAAVAAVNVPDAAASGASGVSYDAEEKAYVGTVGVRFTLPVSFTDETEKGSLSVSGLPSGLSLKKDSWTGEYVITGVPTKESEKTVTFIAKNAAGKHTTTFDFVIDEMPARAIGNFVGLLSDDADGAAHRSACGSVTFTAGKTGALSAKVVTRQAGSRSFSAKGYTRLDADTLFVAMTNSTKEVFEATLSLTNGLYDTFIEGRAYGGEKKGTLGYYAEEGTLVAVRNAFLKSDKNEEALEILADWKGTYEATILDTATNEVGTVSYKVADNGNVTVKVVINQTYDGETKVAKKTISGTVSGGFLYNEGLKKAGTGVALRSGTYLWSSEVLFDNDEDTAAGAARYIRPNAEYKTEVVDVDQIVQAPND